MPPVGRHVGQKVPPDRVLEIRRVEVDDVLRPSPWDELKQLRGEVAVRVDEANAMAGVDVLHQKVPKKRGLAGAGFADHVDVVAAVGGANAKTLPLAAEVGLPEIDDGLVGL